MKLILPIAALAALCSSVAAQDCTTWVPDPYTPLADPVLRAPVCPVEGDTYSLAVVAACDAALQGILDVKASAEAELVLEVAFAEYLLDIVCDNYQDGLITEASYNQQVDQIALTYNATAAGIVSGYEAAKVAAEIAYFECLRLGCGTARMSALDDLGCTDHPFYLPPIMEGSWYDIVPECLEPIPGCADTINAKYRAKHANAVALLNQEYLADVWIFMDVWQQAVFQIADCGLIWSQSACCTMHADLVADAITAYQDLIAKRGVLATREVYAHQIFKTAAKKEIAKECCGE